jgi:hypothetical protein
MVRAPRAAGRKKVRFFFSEEKKQKTFILALADRSGTWPDRGDSGKVKVFWFFSSEKNILSSLIGAG